MLNKLELRFSNQYSLQMRPRFEPVMNQILVNGIHLKTQGKIIVDGCGDKGGDNRLPVTCFHVLRGSVWTF